MCYFALSNTCNQQFPKLVGALNVVKKQLARFVSRYVCSIYGIFWSLLQSIMI